MVDLNVLIAPGAPEISDDFEDGNYTGWSTLNFGGGTVAVAAGSANGSSYGLRCDSVSYSSQQSLQRSVTVSAGGVYVLEADYRLDTVPTTTGGLGLFYINQVDGGNALELVNDPDSSQSQPWRLTILQKTAGYYYTTTAFSNGPVAGEWCRLSMELDQSGATRYGRLYKNGVLVATVSDASTGTVNVTPTAIVIGSYSAGSYSDCDVDNVAFYEGTWHAPEVTALSEAATLSPPPLPLSAAEASQNVADTIPQDGVVLLGGAFNDDEVQVGEALGVDLVIAVSDIVEAAQGVSDEPAGVRLDCPASATESAPVADTPAVTTVFQVAVAQAVAVLDSIRPTGRGW